MYATSNMSTIEKATDLLPFLFMGCWNKKGEPSASVARAITENPITTLVLGGDNIYPEKQQNGNDPTKFTKVYSLETLTEGIHMLHGKTIYTALGNHNVVDAILPTQLGLKEWTIPNRYYSVNFRDLTLVVIDSNLVTTDEYGSMKDWLSGIIAILKEAGKRYYYVQHDPFLSFKKNKTTALRKFSELLAILAEHPPVAVLCADTHNYQSGTLQIGAARIRQYVVGTGGAVPDYVAQDKGSAHTAEDVTYTMDDYITGYGYLEITPATTHFIKVEDWRSYEGKGGGKRRTKTYKKRTRSRRRHYL